MKNLITAIFVLLCLNSFSQITLDFQDTIMSLRAIHLTNSETKYLDDNQWTMNTQNQFQLYNLDGTLYKTISMPLKPNNNSSFFYSIPYIARTLFDNDPSNIEYIVQYEWDSLPPNGYNQDEVKVIREDGTVLLDELNGHLYSINSTEEGTKLILTYFHPTGGYISTKVFTLPGDIPTNIRESNILSDIKPLVYPNPNNGTFYIKFSSNLGDSEIINLYSSTGVLINSYQSKSCLTHLQNLGLTDGMYFINTITDKTNSTTKIIIKK